MSTKSIDVRCKQCAALLARHERDGICIVRGGMQSVVSGVEFTVAITCYRCQTLNMVAREIRAV